MSAIENVEVVKSYYDKSQKWWPLFFGDEKSLAIHYGFWEKGTTRSEALINPYKTAARLLEIRNGERLLDAGCGLGGALLWLASKYDINATGITISSSQLEQAKKY